MSSKNHAERLGHALESTRVAQVVNLGFDTDKISVIFRVLPGAETAWMKLVERLKLAEEDQSPAMPWKIDISKPYLLKNRKLVFGWRVVLTSSDMSTTLDTLNLIIKGEPLPQAAVKELTEFPFSGFAPGTTDRNIPKNRKGVYMVEGKKGAHPLKGDEQ